MIGNRKEEWGKKGKDSKGRGEEKEKVVEEMRDEGTG